LKENKKTTGKAKYGHDVILAEYNKISSRELVACRRNENKERKY